MKVIITAILIFFSLTTFAQRDTTKTILYQHTDTVIVSTIIYAKHNKVKTTSGFAVRQGFLVNTDKGLLWYSQPQIIAVLDNKKRVIDNPIQIK
ncbi:MAG: hypothetical protein JWO92_1115 [Chitinophagaceae bacterium]|nr:hypothetical protein [Chitinophagaceae bacterium]